MQAVLAKLPEKEVPEEERRSPSGPAALHAYLNAFFARHLFQVQNSLAQHADVLEILAIDKRLTFFDVGSGPGVASLALLEILQAMRPLLPQKIRVSLVLNDSSEFCLSWAHEFLQRYTRVIGEHAGFVVEQVTRISTPFPDSIAALRRISQAVGGPQLAVLGYVLGPLDEQLGIKKAGESLMALRQACGVFFRAALVIQDRYREQEMRCLARETGGVCTERTLAQEVYDEDNSCEKFTYRYFELALTGSTPQGLTT